MNSIKQSFIIAFRYCLAIIILFRLMFLSMFSSKNSMQPVVKSKKATTGDAPAYIESIVKDNMYILSLHDTATGENVALGSIRAAGVALNPERKKLFEEMVLGMVHEMLMESTGHKFNISNPNLN